MNDPNCQKCLGRGKIYRVGGPTQQCDCFITNPAPKGKEMECVDCGAKCADVPICNDCNRKRHERWTRTAERRAVARDAYMAALGGIMTHEGQCGGFKFTDMQAAEYAETIALETVRRWDSFLAAVDAELKSTDHYQRSLDEMHLRYNVEAELAAANDTLDRLRKVVGPSRTISNSTCMKMVDILYPTETTNDDR